MAKKIALRMYIYIYILLCLHDNLSSPMKWSIKRKILLTWMIWSYPSFSKSMKKNPNMDDFGVAR